MRKLLGWSLASAMLVGILQFTPTLMAQNQTQQPSATQQQQDPTQANQQAQQQTFMGKVAMSHGKYVLQSQDSKTAYTLDDQQKAKQFDGQNVKVTGTLDSQSNVIHVSDIQPS